MAVKRHIKLNLADDKLRGAVLKACLHSTHARSDRLGELGDFEGLRDRARQIRQHALDNQPALLKQFKENFTAAGGKVHHADKASDACEIALDILRSRGATRGVKSKSMVTEEIELGKALAQAGIDAVESDLGEFIVQLAGEPPSHITAPALHRSRQEVAALFRKKLNVSCGDDPVELAGVARKHLRERFLKADFAISGANFLVADTGHLVIVENEGNAFMGTALPPVYISVTGIDKVIAGLNDLAPLLKLLPPSATGQRTEAYSHLLKPAEEGQDGASDFHLILLDNGRSRTLADEALREMLLCIRCGACLNVCPVYRTVGGHAYESVYPGPMGAVLSNLLGDETAKHAELPQLSTLCGACRDVCPVKIDIPRLLLELRARSQKSLPERIAAGVFEWTMASPARLDIMGRLAGLAGRLLPGGLPGGWLREDAASWRESSVNKIFPPYEVGGE